MDLKFEPVFGSAGASAPIIVKFFPHKHCPLGQDHIIENEIDYGTPCRNDCMWFRSAGMELQPFCVIAEALLHVRVMK